MLPFSHFDKITRNRKPVEYWKTMTYDYSEWYLNLHIDSTNKLYIFATKSITDDRWGIRKVEPNRNIKL